MTGSFTYALWLSNSSDSVFAERHLGPIQYTLNFYDTVGNLVASLDSVTLSDSVAHIAPALRTVYLDRLAPSYGYVRLDRTGGILVDSAARAQDIITPKKLTSLKQAVNGRSFTGSTDSIALSLTPNPAHGRVGIGFQIPTAGIATIDVMDVLGKKVGEVVSRQMSAGGHEIFWHPSAGLSSGIYTVRLFYGDRIVSNRVMYIR